MFYQQTGSCLLFSFFPAYKTVHIIEKENYKVNYYWNIHRIFYGCQAP